MPVENLARSEVITASTDESTQEIATTMDDEKIGSVVITDGDEPVGIVTDRDLAIHVVGAGQDPTDVTAEAVMSSDLCTIRVDILPALKREDSQALGYYGLQPACSLGAKRPEG